jgi:hypothetical protein
LVTYDLTAGIRIVEQLPAVAVGAAIEIVGGYAQAFDLPEASTRHAKLRALSRLEVSAMRDHENVPLEDEIAIEQLAEELWHKETDGTVASWEEPSILAKQAWRNRTRMEVAIWSKEIGTP